MSSDISRPRITPDLDSCKLPLSDMLKSIIPSYVQYYGEGEDESSAYAELIQLPNTASRRSYRDPSKMKEFLKKTWGKRTAHQSHQCAYETNRAVLLTESNTCFSGNSVNSTVNYTVNNIGQRTNATRIGAAAKSTAWSYDALGQHSRRFVGRAEFAEQSPERRDFFMLGKNHQLTSADDSKNDADRKYQCNGIGNRLTSSASVSPTSSPPNAVNQYSALSGSAFQLLSFTYDLDGNMTSRPLPADPNTNSALTWVAENRMITATDNRTTITYHYDSQSHRIAQNTATNTSLYVYDGWNCIAEYQLLNTSFILQTYLLWLMDRSKATWPAGQEMMEEHFLQRAGGDGCLLSTTDHGLLHTSQF